MIYKERHINNFTKVDNKLLKDKELSLAAKGLLIIMLSLPDNWNYSTLGLSALTKESKNTIHRLLKELESKNYLIRESIRDSKGRFVKYNYNIYELPYLNIRDMELPDMDNEDIINKINNKDEIDETLLSGYTKELIRRGFISKDDFEINKYEEMYKELNYEYDYKLIYMCTNYILKMLKINRYKDEYGNLIDDRFNYLKASLINNLKIITNDVRLWEFEEDESS